MFINMMTIGIYIAINLVADNLSWAFGCRRSRGQRICWTLVITLAAGLGCL